MAGVPRTENTGMDGGPCGKGAVLLRLLGRKSLASSTLAPSASRSAVIGHGIGPGIQSAKTGWIGMAERSRAYVSDAFAHIPPWCNGSTRVFGTFGPGSKPGGGAWRQHVELISPTLDSMLVVPDIQGFRRHPRPRKRRHALVAQWIERPSPERKVTSPILVEGTHENSANHNAWSPSSLLSQTVAPRTVRASRGNALVAQRIERRFPKPGAAGPTPAGGTSAAFNGLALSKNRNHWSPDRPPL
mgnify:CR=1 FL=1